MVFLQECPTTFGNEPSRAVAPCVNPMPHNMFFVHREQQSFPPEKTCLIPSNLPAEIPPRDPKKGTFNPERSVRSGFAFFIFSYYNTPHYAIGDYRNRRQAIPRIGGERDTD